MPTTLSLDDEVAVQLKQLRACDGPPFRQLINDALRVWFNPLRPA